MLLMGSMSIGKASMFLPLLLSRYERGSERERKEERRERKKGEGRDERGESN